MSEATPLDTHGLELAACGARLWRGPRTRHLTVVVKQLVELVQGGRAKPIAGAEIVAKDRHYRQLPSRSVEAASDLAPYLARCDVTLRGHAHAPPGQPAARLAVRLAIAGRGPVLDKTLHVFGDRGQAGEPQPIARVPLDYEHAFGGRNHDGNPVGRGADKTGATAQPPNLVDPADPLKPACFAPISRYWPARARLLGAVPRAVADGHEPELPDAFDWRYYQSAPPDQQVPYLAGDEWIALDGVHPALPRVSTQLPGIRGHGLVYTWQGSTFRSVKPIELVLDTLAIDADRNVAALAWRGSMVLDADADESTLKIVGAVQLAGGAVSWPDPRTLRRAPAAPPPSAVPSVDGGATQIFDPETASVRIGAGTMAASPDDEETLRKLPAVPFRAPVAPAAARPVAPVAAPPAPEPEPERAGTLNLSADEDFQAQHVPSTPFREGTSPESALLRAREAAAASPPPSSDAAGLGQTVGLSFGEAHLAARRPVTPFPSAQLTPRSQGSGRWTFEAPEATTDAGAPPTVASASLRDTKAKRRSPTVPVVNPTTLSASTAAWQVRPPQDSLTVIVKGTFDIVPGGPATLRDESDPLQGDAFADDEVKKSLLQPTDFAIVKPRADVVLIGHARAAKPTAAARVTFRFGSGAQPKGFERTIAVLGERAWKVTATSRTPGPPAPFTEMPLSWERAFGGRPGDPNPVGTGWGETPLPNLEDPKKPILGPSDAPAAACFAPIAPTWPDRASRLGTYDDAWLATRWPYFPADFDWGYAQCAPSAQQVEHLVGDEAFEIVGVSVEHPKLAGTLPAIRARAFAQETAEAGGAFFEIALSLDTACFEVDEMKLTLVWRGLVEVSDDEAPDLEAIFIHHETLAEAAKSVSAVRELYRETLAEDDEEEDPGPMLTPEPPPAPLDPAVREACVAALAAGASLAERDLAGADLTGLDFTERPMSGASLHRATLRGVSLARAELEGAQLAGADLRDADLSGARLAGADLTGALLEGAKLDGADLEGADLSLVSAERASFRGTRGEGAVFAGAQLASARFEKAELASADFTGAMLDGAVFDAAVMPEVRLAEVRAARARFDGARLVGARCDDALLEHCSFKGAALDGSTWESAILDGSSFAKATLVESSFARAQAENVELEGVDASRSNFARAQLGRARFRRANLVEADFERADLRKADLRGANLHAAETWKAKLQGALLDEAILTQTKLAPRSG
jgi:uncharacterized protein YjbI with pentapeptide repeats